MADIQALAEQLVNLTVKDVQELSKILEEQYGIKPAAAAPVMVAGAAVAAAPAVAEQTEFDVVLKDVGAKKLEVVKVVKDLTGLNLMQAKELVEKGPGTPIKEKVSKDEANDIKAKIEGAGGAVEIK
jgi:large subunit ribosomal protein L7/L12